MSNNNTNIKENKKNNKSNSVKESEMNMRITSKYTFEDERIIRGYELITEHEDETKTNKIKMLGNLKIPATYIAKMLETHYSFVHTILTKNDIEVVEKRTKSDEMREMFDEGLTISQVAKKMNAHYSYVHGVHKRYMNKKNKSK